ncbi:MAG: hypothetical protein SVR08_16620 [Spirochaetota bacterium]|nr:hypothetical protein [Spirochaetota bacterium]
MTILTKFMFTTFLLCISLFCLISCSKSKGFLKDTKTDIPQKSDTAETSVDKDLKVNSNVIEIKKYMGKYKIEVFVYKGILDLNMKDDKPYGTIRFQNWGNGAVEYLKDITIKGSKISFIRSITTPEEKKRIGSTRYLRQRFIGKFSKDGNSIYGYFEERGSQSTWKAER